MDLFTRLTRRIDHAKICMDIRFEFLWFVAIVQRYRNGLRSLHRQAKSPAAGIARAMSARGWFDGDWSL